MILRTYSVSEKRITLLQRSVSPWLGVGTSGIISVCFTAVSPGAPGIPGGRPEGAEKMLPQASSLLLIWAVLMGWRELMESGQSCTEITLPWSNFSAKHSRAEGTACKN